jgi:hypothetical protein
MNDGHGRTRTSNQTVTSALVGLESLNKLGIFRRVQARSSRLFTGFLWSICGPFPVSAEALICGSGTAQKLPERK